MKEIMMAIIDKLSGDNIVEIIKAVLDKTEVVIKASNRIEGGS